MSLQRALRYYGRWLHLTFDPANKVFKSARNFFAFFGPLALIVLTYVINQHYPLLGPRMSEVVSYIPVLIVFVVLPALFLLAPYRMHEEQEEKIERLNGKLYDRAKLQAQCDEIADLIDEGRRVQRLYAERAAAPTTDESATWQEKVRTYLQENFGRASVVQWENNGDLDLPESPPPTRIVLTPIREIYSHPPSAPIFSIRGKNSYTRLILNVRLTRLNELLTKLQDRLA